MCVGRHNHPELPHLVLPPSQLQMTSTKQPEAVTPPPRRFHPRFQALPQGPPNTHCAVLRSSEGTCFRVPAFTLRSTSAFFRRLLPPPTAPSSTHHGTPSHVEPTIEIDESDAVLERALRMICGLETPPWASFAELEDVLPLLEKWDAPGPLSTIRYAITAPLFLQDPLRLYALATRLGWRDEARLASTHTLALSIYDPEHRTQLERLAAKDLLVLLAFHRRRRDEFRAYVDSVERFSAGNSEGQIFCRHCGVEEVQHHTWRELKARMFEEMDRRPLGDTIADLDMEEWPEAVACWNAKCRGAACGGLIYDKLHTLRNLRAGVDDLPTTI